MPLAPFDVIVLRHVIEHLNSPLDTLVAIQKSLSPNGVIVVEAPIEASTWKKIMGRRWTGYFFPYHTLVLSELGALMLFESAGLEVVKKNRAEPAILGVYLMTLGIPRSLARILSICFYPLQLLVSRLSGNSEAMVFILKKQ
jgi:hypothetical protein